MGNRIHFGHSLWVLWSKLFFSFASYDHHIIPSKGAALLVGNIFSTLDFLWIGLSTKRRITFFVNLSDYPSWTHPYLPFLGVKELTDPDAILSYLQKNRLVCVFASDEIPVQAEMTSVSSFVMALLPKVPKDIPIIAFYLYGTYRSFYSKAFKSFVKSIPRNARNIRGIAFAPISPSISKGDLKRQLLDLSAKAFRVLEEKIHSIGTAWIDQAKLKPNTVLLEDPELGTFTKRQLLVRTLWIAQKLKKNTSDYVGLMLPASPAAMIFNMAALLAGKTVVNFNFTAGVEALANAYKQTKPDRIITSIAFVKRMQSRAAFLPKLDSDQHIYSEPILEEINQKRVTLCLYTLVMFLPAWLLKCLYAPRIDRHFPCGVLFSSGSEGAPKGVVLTHANILSNIEQCRDIICSDRHDKMISSLPPFHAFGFTTTVLLPLIAGMRTVCFPEPTNAVAMAETIERYQATVICATPTFLGIYVRQKKVLPHQLQSLRYAIAGAEKLRPEIRDGFYKKFSIPIFEGYGATEISPVTGVNISDRDHPRATSNPWHKEGTIGMPLPGITVRVVDPDTMTPLPPNEDGLLLVGGVQVMQRYLHMPEKTNEVIFTENDIRWYKTGDKGHIDDEAFVTIVDRYSRFAKIGGEMVSLAMVERSLQEIYAQHTQHDIVPFPAVAVSVPNVTKGEEIIILGEGAEFLEELKHVVLKSALPPLLKPSKYVLVEALPLLGSGKQDFAASKKLAEEMTSV